MKPFEYLEPTTVSEACALLKKGGAEARVFAGGALMTILMKEGLLQPKTLIIITFLAGLLPVIGNLISNSVIVVVSLGQSLQIAIASLLFLIVIHKLEYFLNARIIGTQIRAQAWELLLAMLAMEAAFGIMGVVNLAHGGFYMLGAYLAWSLSATFGSLTLAILGGAAGMRYHRRVDKAGLGR